MADVELLPCAECGMPCRAGEYHPFAACLMFKACHNSETVRANLAPLHAEIEALRAEVEGLHEQLRLATVDQVNAEAEANDARAENERLAEALQELVDVFSESGMYDEEVFARARAALRARRRDEMFALLREQEEGK